MLGLISRGFLGGNLPGIASSIVSPSPVPVSPWTLQTTQSTFLGTINPLSLWGYNADIAARNVADASCYLMQEANYDTGAGRWCELHWDVTSTAGVARRPFGISVDRDNPDSFAAVGFFISSGSAFAINKISDGTALVEFGGTGHMTLGKNFAQIIFGGTIAQIQATQGPLYLTTASGGVQMSGGLGCNGMAPSYPIIATGTGKTVDQLITVLQGMGLVRQS